MSWIQGYFDYYTIGFYPTNHNANSLISCSFIWWVKNPSRKRKINLFTLFLFVKNCSISNNNNNVIYASIQDNIHISCTWVNI
jgi:hypothetical protein